MSHEAETGLFAEYFNEVCASVDSCKKYLPLDEDNVFEQLADGVIVANVMKTLPRAQLPGRLIKAPASDDAAKKSNHEAVLKAFSTMKTNIDAKAEDLISGEGIDMHDYVWEVLRAHLMKDISLIERVAIIRALKKGEGLDQLLELNHEGVLLRWANYHLQRAGSDKEVKRFSADFADINVYIIILGQVCEKIKPKLEPVKAMENGEKKAEALFEVLKEVGLNKYATVDSLANNYWRVNLAFAANIFNNYIGMMLPSEEEMDELMGEFRTLRAKLAECEEECARLNAEIELLENEMKLTDSRVKCEEISLTILDQLKKLEELKKIKDDLTAKKQELSDRVGSQNAEAQEMSNKLIEETNKVNTKTRTIQEHIEKCSTLLNETGQTLEEKKEFDLKYDESDERTSMVDCLASQNEVLEILTEYIKQIDEKFLRNKSDAKLRMEEINSMVSEYLGAGQSDPGDAIANLKRLLELMIEKCKKQATQIAIFDATIDKMDDLNALVSEKVKVYADSNVGKKKKKTKK